MLPNGAVGDQRGRQEAEQHPHRAHEARL
jgi:hypothetical protein